MDDYVSYFQDTKGREPLLAFPDKKPIAGQPKDAADHFRKSAVWLDTYGTPKSLLWATPGLRVEEEVARACAEKLRRGQIVNTS